MRRIRASAMALIIAATTLLYAYVLYKPSDHEAVSELPTAQADVLAPPIADVNPKSAVTIKPLNPVKSDVKSSETVKKADYKRQTESKAETLTVEATFYTASCKGCSGITKTGDDVRKTIYVDKMRVIAVDPRVIPLRSIVRVSLADGQSFEAITSDIGGMIKGKRIDVLVASYDEAIRLGRQQATITIIKLGGD